MIRKVVIRSMLCAGDRIWRVQRCGRRCAPRYYLTWYQAVIDTEVHTIMCRSCNTQRIKWIAKTRR